MSRSASVSVNPAVVTRSPTKSIAPPELELRPTESVVGDEHQHQREQHPQAEANERQALATGLCLIRHVHLLDLIRSRYGQRASGAPSQRSFIANASTRFRFNFVSRFTGLPIGSIAATAT
jgi:hypothetical protein